MGIVKSFGGLVAARFCLGIAESPLFPGISYYLVSWYKREECESHCLDTCLCAAGTSPCLREAGTSRPESDADPGHHPQPTSGWPFSSLQLLSLERSAASWRGRFRRCVVLVGSRAGRTYPFCSCR